MQEETVIAKYDRLKHILGLYGQDVVINYHDTPGPRCGFWILTTETWGWGPDAGPTMPNTG
jgi:hypothetical protein